MPAALSFAADDSGSYPQAGRNQFLHEGVLNALPGSSLAGADEPRHAGCATRIASDNLANAPRLLRRAPRCLDWPRRPPAARHSSPPRRPCAPPPPGAEKPGAAAWKRGLKTATPKSVNSLRWIEHGRAPHLRFPIAGAASRAAAEPLAISCPTTATPAPAKSSRQQGPQLSRLHWTRSSGASP